MVTGKQILGALTSSWATPFPIENQKLLLCGLKRRAGRVPRDLMTTAVTSQCWHMARGGCSRGVRRATPTDQEGTVPTTSGHQGGRCDGPILVHSWSSCLFESLQAGHLILGVSFFSSVKWDGRTYLKGQVYIYREINSSYLDYS